MKRYIASDFHDGNKVADYDRVIAFLDLVDNDADEFIILGDFGELMWSNFNIISTVSPYRDVIDRIKQIAGQRPTKIVLGNHDWNLGLFASRLEPVKIVSAFAEDGVYYCHGHEFDWLALITGTPVDPVYWNVALPFVFPLLLPVWLVTRIYAKAEDVYDLGVILLQERARAYATKHGYHTVIFGHTHFPVDEMRGGVRLVNDGDQMDSYSYVVQENGMIEVKFFT